MSDFFLASVVTFFASFIVIPLLVSFVKFILLYVIVEERQCRIYVLFGNVVAVIDEPGLHSLWEEIGSRAWMAVLFGDCYVVDLRLDQEYLRSQPVNSEEGAPMGIGIWYEMFISDPVAYTFKNTDPRGSLRANISNATVRCLSNLRLSDMLENRHSMSQSVRDEVSPKSQEWGYSLGSIYIRKVHFRDVGMIKQIEEKVVNRLRQVTSGIRQDGSNQVNIITSTADRQAAVEFAKAAAMRPFIVGSALQQICQDQEVAQAMFEILENQKMLEGDVNVTLIPAQPGGILPQVLAAGYQLNPGANPSTPPEPPTANPAPPEITTS